MIAGMGTDIVAIARLQDMWERHGEKMLDKMLAPAEQADFAAARDKGRFLAKRFAAKEALAKALGTGVRPPALLPDMAICHDALGKPFFSFSGALAEKMQNDGLSVHLSISDEAEFAVACVILEKP